MAGWADTWNGVLLNENCQEVLFCVLTTFLHVRILCFQKVLTYTFILHHSVHWGINLTPSKTPPPLFPQSPL